MEALIKITEKIRESIDKGKFGCGIFLLIYVRPLTQLTMKFFYSKWNIMELEAQL